MPDGPISGKFAHGYIGNNLIRGLAEWTFTEEADELDGTTGEDEGFDHPDDGVARGTLELTVIYFVGTSSYSPIKRGTAVTELFLYETAADGGDPAVYIPKGKVFRSSRQGPVKGRLEVRATIKTVGPFETNETIA
jgi:hypothetical protein